MDGLRNLRGFLFSGGRAMEVPLEWFYDNLKLLLDGASDLEGGGNFARDHQIAEEMFRAELRRLDGRAMQ